MYDVHLRLIGKYVVDFLFVLIELFLLGATALRRYERMSTENRSAISPNGVSYTQNFRYKGSPRTNHSSSQKTKLSGLSYSIKIWKDLFPFCHNPRI